MDAQDRFWQSASRFLGTIGQVGGKLYNADAERKYYDYQNSLAGKTSSLMQSLETDPDYGEIMIDDFETFARPQIEQAGYDYDTIINTLGGNPNPESKLGIFYQGLVTQYNDAVNNMEPTGYMKRWNKLMDEAERAIDDITNPRAQEAARKHFDGIKRTGAASIYEKQVSAWKEDTLAREIADMDKYAESGDSPENVMAYVNERLDYLRSVNAITPARYEAAQNIYAGRAMGTSLSNNALSVLENGTIHDARKYLNEADGSFMFGGREYFVTDQARETARRKIEQSWQDTTAAENSRMDSLYQNTYKARIAAVNSNTPFDPDAIRGGLTFNIIDRANLDVDQKMYWRSRLEGMGQGTGDLGTLNYGAWAEEYASRIEFGENTINDGVNWVTNQYLDGRIDAEQERQFVDNLMTALKKRVPSFGTDIDTLKTLLNTQANEYKGKDSEPVIVEGLAHLSLALDDLLRSVTRKEMEGPEFKARIGTIRDTYIGFLVDSAKGDHTIGGLEILGMNQPLNRAINLMADLEMRGEGVYQEQRSGIIKWEPATKQAYDILEPYLKDRILVEQYGLPATLISDLQVDQYGDVNPIPIYTDINAKKSYIVQRSEDTKSLTVTEIDHATKQQTVLQPAALIQRQQSNAARAASRAAASASVATANLFQPLATLGTQNSDNTQDKLPEPPAEWIRRLYKGDRTAALQAWNGLSVIDQRDVYDAYNEPLPVASGTAR